MRTLRSSIEAYIRAKDGNRVHLLEPAFEDDVELITQLRTTDISFPGRVEGREAVATTLVSDFTKRYENIYTFCVAPAPADDVESLECSWIVCMTEKDSKAARLGTGRYAWHGNAGCVSKLVITIDEMLVLDAEVAEPLLAWASSLPYPWCTVDEVCLHAPSMGPLPRILELLRKGMRSAQ